MAWGSPPPPPSKPEADDERGSKGRYALPPACPRCELTKGQMNRTIQNYQKAYRKKVEGLKQELTTVRADNTHLRSQVRRLRRKRLLHAPSIIVGGCLALAATRLLQRLWKQRQGRQGNIKEQQHLNSQGGAKPHAADSTVNGVAAS